MPRPCLNCPRLYIVTTFYKHIDFNCCADYLQRPFIDARYMRTPHNREILTKQYRA